MGLIGLLPLAIGLLSGKEFHGESIDFVQASITGNNLFEGTFSYMSFFGRTEYVHLLAFLFIALFMFLMLLIFRKKAWQAVYPFHM
ncbi:hypothetical protein JQK62_19745, partial [Leptospira santarosai]|nr:hypothetical protein [Leptospira santarosai]